MRWALVIIILGMILFLGSSFFIEPESVEVKPQQSQQSEEESISVILVGDIMLDRGVEYMIKTQGNGDFRFPFLKIANDLKGLRPSHHPPAEGEPLAKLLFGNLEGPISDKGTKVGSIYSFRAEPEAIEGLTFAGFDVLSLANNHAFDYGRTALEDCLTRLSNAGVDYVGAGFNKDEAYSPIIKEVNGVKIAFLAFTSLGSLYWTATENSSGIAWADWNNLEEINPSTELRVNAEQGRSIKKDIENAKSQADILIVSLHSGEEYSQEPTQFQVEFSRAAISAGADLVIGHHPHVVQKNEKYKDKWIFYSLGNFVFDQGFSEETMKGKMLLLTIEDSKIKEVESINIKINNFFQPERK